MDHKTEQDAGLLEQGASMLEEHAEEQRTRGNDSAAEGAACSAHAIRRLAPALLRAGHGCPAQIEEPAAPAAVAGPADELAELAMLNKLIELGAKASYAHAKSNSDDGPAGTAAYVQWQELRAEMGELIRAHVAPALEAPAAPAVPAGFALVPIEPTQQMLDAGRWSGAGSVSIQEEWARKEVWNRMLATITPPPAAYADDLVALVTELVQALRQAAPDNDLAGHALDYLKRNGLQGSPLLAAPAAPAVDAFTHAELLEIKRAVEEFADCNETDVDYALLLRAAKAGYLECTQFHVLNQSALDLDTVAAAQAKEGGAAA